MGTSIYFCNLKHWNQDSSLEAHTKNDGSEPFLRTSTSTMLEKKYVIILHDLTSLL